MRIAVIALGAAGLVAAMAGRAPAYERYNDGCYVCHGAFTNDPYSPPSGGADWATSLHATHRGASYMNTACDLCHTTGDGRDPFTGSSDGTPDTTGYGCAGCHGRLYAGVAIAAGLREHHWNSGVTLCATCHTGDPIPLAESIDPPYFGSVDTNVDDACNFDPGFLEDWSGDGVGLDNDGDLLYDVAEDLDCSDTPDAGPGDVDAGGGAPDASVPDAGGGAPDAGVPDAGGGVPDAGGGAPDAGVPDASAVIPDAAPAAPDARPGGSDAGLGGSGDGGGCGCAAAARRRPGGAAVCLLALLFVVAIRRRSA